MRVAVKAKREPLKQVEGLQGQVDRARELRAQVESLQTELSLVEEDLKAAALDQMRAMEASGETVQALALQGSDEPVKVVRRGVWRKIAPSAEAHMRQVLGDLFERLFEPTVKVSVKSAMATSLVEAAQVAGLDLAKFAKVESYIKPQAKYIARRGELRPSLSSDVNAELDELEDQIRQSTTVTYK